MKIQVTVLIDSIGYKTKPTDKVAKISKRILNNEVTLTVEELAEKIENGHSWCPSTFTDGKRKNANFKQSQVLALDFDSGIEYTAIISKAKDLGITPNLIIPSFSYTPEHQKYRVIWVLEEAIEVSADYTNLIKGLMRIWPESDKSCKDAARLFFGSNQQVLFRNVATPTNLECLSLAINAVNIGEVSDAKKASVAKSLIKVEKSESYNILLDSENSTKIEQIAKVNLPTDISHLMIVQALIQGGRHIQTTKQYKEGERLHYPEILGLALNLQYIVGGLKFLKQAMEDAGCFEPYHFAALNQIRAHNYLPMALENFSPYPSDWEFRNILDATGRVKNEPLDLLAGAGTKQLPYKLEDAEALLRDTFYKTLNKPYHPENGLQITVFKLPTGLGKTELLAKTVGHFGPIVYAFTTNALKSEFAGRMGNEIVQTYLDKETGEIVTTNTVRAYITPELPDCLPEHIKTELDYFSTTGCFKAAKSTLTNYKKSLVDKGDVITADELTQLEALNQYTNDNHKAYGSNDKPILTTHFKALARNDKDEFAFSHANTICFDEDLISTTIEQDTVTREDLQRLLFDTDDEDLRVFCQGLIDEINDARVSTIKPTPFLAFTPEQYQSLVQTVALGVQNNRYSSNVLSYFDSAYYAADGRNGEIHYIKVKPLPQKRILVFSATADENVYRHIFGDKVTFYDYSKVVCKGNLVQDFKYSCSRASLNNPTTLSYVKQRAGNKPVITFKAYKNNFDNPAEAHFGNCSGYDGYKGQDVVICGTPHLPEITYKLFAKAIGIELTMRDNSMSLQPLKRNGFKFNMRTFERQIMQDIQCYLIEKELIQAIGRPRLLREVCEALLFSTYPIRHYGSDHPTQQLEAVQPDYANEF